MSGLENSLKNQSPITSSKDVISRTPKLATSREKIQSKTDDPRKVEIQKAFPKLSQAWINKIYDSYKKYSLDQVKLFFAHAKKYNQEKVPQSLIAVSLIQYAKNAESALVPALYDEYVAQMIAEHQRAVKLSQAFEKNQDPAFEDFKKRKKAKQKMITTIDDVIGGKGFTNDTYFLYEYIESDVFQTNKQAIITSLDAEQKQTFAAYLESDVRLSQIAKVNTAQLQPVNQNIASTTESVGVSAEKNTLQHATQIFERDFGKENGPKVVLDNLPQSVLGNERLSIEEKNKLLGDWQKTLSGKDRTLLVEKNRKLFSKEYTTEEIVMSLIGQNEDNLVEVAAKQGLINLWDQYQQETLRITKEKVMKTYFEQVGDILQAGGDVVQLSNDKITYEADGSIHMAFLTTAGIRGGIYIDKDGVVSVADLFGYQSMIETQSDYDLLKKNLQQRLQGKLPTMRTMLSRVSEQKELITHGWSKAAIAKSSPVIDIESYIGVMITPEEEQARSLLHLNMTKTLLMTQSADAISHSIQTIERIHKPAQQDVFLRYCNGPDMLLDAAFLEKYKPLTILRQTLARGKNSDIERLDSACNMIIDTYTQSTSLSKEKFPFGIDERQGKETFWQFLSRFCISETEFDIRSFEQIAHVIKNQTTPYDSIIDCYADNPGYFPVKSLYMSMYNTESLSDNTSHSNVISETVSSLDDLKLDIDLSKK